MENKSGLKYMYEYKCLVLPDPIEEKTGGGLYKPDVARDKEKHRTCKATFIMAGGNAFEDWNGKIPQPGDRVYVAVAAGMIHEGPDGLEYRIVNDKDIIGELDE